MKQLFLLLFMLVFLGCGHNSPQQSAQIQEQPAVVSPVVAPPVTPPAKIACWGDSMTGPVYVNTLSTLAGIPAYNGAVGGQDSTGIAMRQGGVPFIISIADDTIPTSGAVAVTYKNGAPVINQGGGPLYGWLSGVYGHIDRIPNPNSTINDYTFTRSSTGVAITCPPLSKFAVDTFGRDESIISIWIGRNNPAATDTVVSDVQSMVNLLKGPTKCYVVLSICNGKGEVYEGSAFQKTNDALRSAFPDNFCDVRSAVVAGYNPADPQDVADHSIDTTPASLRGDSVHFNADGATIVAKTVYAFMQAKGWVK
jgi:hypothetical protein